MTDRPEIDPKHAKGPETPADDGAEAATVPKRHYDAPAAGDAVPGGRPCGVKLKAGPAGGRSGGGPTAFVSGRSGTKRIVWRAGWFALVALMAGLAFFMWNLPEDSWLAWREYEAGNITYEEAVEWYWSCRIGMSVVTPLVVGMLGALFLAVLCPKESQDGGARGIREAGK